MSLRYMNIETKFSIVSYNKEFSTKEVECFKPKSFSVVAQVYFVKLLDNNLYYHSAVVGCVFQKVLTAVLCVNF